MPGRACRLLLRRKLDGSDVKYCLSNAPVPATLLQLGQVEAARWNIETEIELTKSEAGLVEYEIRSWAGWYHPMTMGLLAGAFLLQVQQDWGGKDAPHHAAAGEPGGTRVAAAAEVDKGGVNQLAA
ncbi:MAG: hypothetical protein M3Z04_11355 [Chloroflexota bacterium]|nr:hypothetical protein [Chloroflexota bacterium]